MFGDIVKRALLPFQLFCISTMTLLCVPQALLAGDITDQSIQRLFEVSKLKLLVGDVPSSINTKMEWTAEADPKIDAEDIAGFKNYINSIFGVSPVLNVVSREMKATMSESDAKKIIAWYESDIGHEISEAESGIISFSAVMEMKQEKASLLANEPRIEIVKQIDLAARDTDMNLQVTYAMSVGMNSAAAAIENPDESQKNMNGIIADAQAMMPIARKSISEDLLLMRSYAYKDISDSHLQKYISFLEGDVSRRFYEAIFIGLSRAYSDALDQMIEPLSRMVKASKSDSATTHNRSN